MSQKRPSRSRLNPNRGYSEASTGAVRNHYNYIGERVKTTGAKICTGTYRTIKWSASTKDITRYDIGFVTASSRSTLPSRTWMIAVSVSGDIVLVGHEHDGVAVLVEALEKRHDFVAGSRIQGSGGFVGEQNRRPFTSARAIATRCR